MEIKVIKNLPDSLLIEWEEDGILNRGLVAKSLVKGNKIDDGFLSLVEPYGIDWVALLEDVGIQEVTPESIARELTKRGLWTSDDVLRNSMAIQEAVMSAFGITVSKVMKKFNEYQKNK